MSVDLLKDLTRTKLRDWWSILHASQKNGSLQVAEAFYHFGCSAKRPQESRNRRMRYGKVVQYFPAKGFGFIHPDSGPDIFFHITALGACDPQLQIPLGQPVKYELAPNQELKSRSRQVRSDGDSTKPERPARRQAKLVELIDKIPGAILEEGDQEHQSARHPRARQKKPSWRS